MALYSESVAALIEKFSELPGVGKKSAQRVAFHLLSLSEEEVRSFAETMLRAKQTLCFCKICQNMSDKEICDICANPGRDKSVICVVEDPRDVVSIERSMEFRGRYHVLHGVISPSKGIKPDDIKLRELVARIDGSVKEVIVATNLTVEGETTAMYIAKILAPLGVEVTRIAHGLPVGGDIIYADEITLAKALAGRTKIS
ncbi:MAG: recombination mediator RecR [Clostridia bacterium]|nr:recombination mediator RecR [Clostridia bacterium]